MSLYGRTIRRDFLMKIISQQFISVKSGFLVSLRKQHMWKRCKIYVIDDRSAPTLNELMRKNI